MVQQVPWSIEQDVREDADSVFVPVAQLPLADIGDVVEVGTTHSGTRPGHITALVEDDQRGDFYTVELDRPPT
jgi:hypothetical protein